MSFEVTGRFLEAVARSRDSGDVQQKSGRHLANQLPVAWWSPGLAMGLCRYGDVLLELESGRVLLL